MTIPDDLTGLDYASARYQLRRYFMQQADATARDDLRDVASAGARIPDHDLTLAAAAMFEALGGTTLLDRPPVVEMARGFRSGMTDELIWLGTFLLRTLGEAEKIMQEQREGMGL